MAYGTATITTSATAIVAANTVRVSLLIRNNGSVTVYLGTDTSVTASNGYPLEAGEQIVFDFENLEREHRLFYRGAWYGIVSSGTCDIRYIDLVTLT